MSSEKVAGEDVSVDGGAAPDTKPLKEQAVEIPAEKETVPDATATPQETAAQPESESPGEPVKPPSPSFEPVEATIQMDEYEFPATSEEPEGDEPADVETGSIYTPIEEEQQEDYGRKSPSLKSQMSKLSQVSQDRKSVLSEISKMIEEEEDVPTLDEAHHDSMFTQAGSYETSSSSSAEAVEDDTMPRNFQDYVKKYSTLFHQMVGKEESPCDEEAGKTFLKIDLNEIVSGYKTEDKQCRDVKTSLVGLTRIRPHLVCIENENIVLRKDYKDCKGVRTLSGGHMGMEPLYIDYVGKGLLTGVVLGTVSDPPSVGSVTKAIRELAHGSSGLLIIILNNVEYRLIFGLAMERIRMEGFTEIDMVTVGDDCFERCKSPVGRRGLGGVILLFKLVGSMSECDKTLREIYVAARSASKTIVTISCMTKPFKAVGTGLDKNSKDGIHFNGDNCHMIKRMIDYCVHPMKYFSMRFDPEDNVIVFINNYRTTNPEFYVTVEYIVQELEKRKIRIERLYADNFLTGFWPGYSISLMLDCNGCRSFFMDAPCSSPLWPRYPSKGLKQIKRLENQKCITFVGMGPMLTKTEAKQTKNAVITACKSIILCENVLNAMHFFGNYGTKLKLGAEAIMQGVRQSTLDYSRPFNLLIEISEILIEKLPGVMGAMYGCLFEGAARSFIRNPLTTITAQSWSEAMDEALKTLRAYTNTKGGIVSLALSLIPVVSAIHGPYIRLIQKSTRNPILIALDSLRSEIEERLRQTSDEKESLLKNQLDVESYALIIWLHAVYSSVYWKIPSDSSPSISISEEKSSYERSSRSKSRSSKDPSKSFRTSSIKGINKSLEFIASSEQFHRDSVPAQIPSKQQSVSSKSSQSGKVFT